MTWRPPMFCSLSIALLPPERWLEAVHHGHRQKSATAPKWPRIVKESSNDRPTTGKTIPLGPDPIPSATRPYRQDHRTTRFSRRSSTDINPRYMSLRGFIAISALKCHDGSAQLRLSGNRSKAPIRQTDRTAGTPGRFRLTKELPSESAVRDTQQASKSTIETIDRAR